MSTTTTRIGPAIGTARIAGDAALDRLADAGYEDLLDACGPADPLRRLGWLRAWRRTAGRDVEPRTVLVDRDRALVAAAPLEAARRGGLVIVRHLAHADAWFDPAPPARDEEARLELLRAVAAEPGDVLLLDGLPATPEWSRAVADAVPGARLAERPPAWRLTLAEPPRSMRKRRKEAGRSRRRAAERGVSLSTTVARAWEEIAPRLDDLLAFQHRNFPGPEPNQLAAPGPRRELARAGIAALGGEGRARLVEVRDGAGALAAFDLALVDGAGAVAYAGAFDRARDDVDGLGWISMLSLVEVLGEEGVEVVDFGAGPAAYKDLIAVPVPLVRAVAPRSRRGRATLAGHALAAWTRAAVARARARGRA